MSYTTRPCPSWRATRHEARRCRSFPRPPSRPCWQPPVPRCAEGFARDRVHLPHHFPFAPIYLPITPVRKPVPALVWFQGAAFLPKLAARAACGASGPCLRAGPAIDACIRLRGPCPGGMVWFAGRFRTSRRCCRLAGHRTVCGRPGRDLARDMEVAGTACGESLEHPRQRQARVCLLSTRTPQSCDEGFPRVVTKNFPGRDLVHGVRPTRRIPLAFRKGGECAQI